MDYFCPGLIFVVMMICIWVYEEIKKRRYTCMIFPLSNGTKFGMLTLVIGFALIMILLCVGATLLIQ
jgi:hypothetical protein